MPEEKASAGIVIAASTNDTAGLTLANELKRLGNFFQTSHAKNSDSSFNSKEFGNITMHLSSNSALNMDYLDTTYPESEAFIFLSKHQSESGIPALTCHSVGNFSHSLYGGRPGELGIAFPSLQKNYMIELSKRSQSVQDYEIVIEATHHGPTSLTKPTIFIELGSSDEQWHDKVAAAAICKSLVSAIRTKSSSLNKVAICLGGTHYPAKFNKLLMESDFSFGAVASKHNLDSVDEQMLHQMINKSVEPVTHVIVDSKGLGNQKDRILNLVTDCGLPVVML